jgi:hypothetical protein
MRSSGTLNLRGVLTTGLLALVLVFSGQAVRAQDGGDDGEGGGPPEGKPPVTRGRAHLTPTEEECAVAGASGKAHLVSNPGHDFIHVVLHGLEEGAVFEVRICLGDDQEVLGSVTIRPEDEDDDEVDEGDMEGGAGVDDGEEDEDGTSGVLRIDTNRGDILPFGADDVSDLYGTMIKVADADGCIVLSGEVVPRPNGGGGPDDDGEGMVLALLSVPHDASFIRGDTTMDGEVTITDPIQTLNLLFLGGVAPYCLDAADANDDAEIDISDPLMTLSSLFLGYSPTPPPTGARGFDPTPDALHCQ